MRSPVSMPGLIMSDTAQLYASILGLTDQWIVVEVNLDLEAGEVSVFVAAAVDKKFGCPECGKPSSRHDHRTRRWRHLDSVSTKLPLRPRCRESCARGMESSRSRFRVRRRAYARAVRAARRADALLATLQRLVRGRWQLGQEPRCPHRQRARDLTPGRATASRPHACRPVPASVSAVRAAPHPISSWPRGVRSQAASACGFTTPTATSRPM